MLYPNPTPECFELSEILDKEHGLFTPFGWFEALRTKAGLTDSIGINILSEITYWYRISPVFDENGKVVNYAKKFKSELLQKSYKQLSEKFGYTERQVKDAVLRLEQRELIKRVFKTVEINGTMVSNIMYIQVFPTAIKRISWVEISEDPRKKDTTKLEKKVDLSRKNETPHTKNRRYTETTTKNTTKNTSNNNNIVETSSTAFEREKLEYDPSKWEWTDQDQTATSYGEILKAENAINAVEKTEISEHTQTTNQTKKTAPRANKSAKSGNVELLQKPCVDWFMEFYANRYGVPYSFKGGADAKAVSEILKYLRTLFSKSTDDYVFQKFQDVCNETTNGWVLKNGHKLTIIASEVANIAAELKQRKEAAEQARLNALNPQNNVQQPNHNTKKRRAG